VPQLTPQQPPPPDYYAGNLRVLLGHVRTFYDDLLTEDERQFIESLLNLSTGAQRLYARLLGRKGPWIRVDKLAYREIEDVSRAIDELARTALVTINEAGPADALLGLLTQAERFACFPELPRDNRTAWIERCVERHDDVWIRRKLSESYTWVSVNDYRHVKLCQLLFFGDDRQDTSTFVLQDLGLFSFEDYPLRQDQRLFADRAAMNRFRRLRRLSGLAHRLADHPDLAGWLARQLRAETHSRQEQRQRDRTLNRLGHWFERQRDFDRALDCYALSGMHPSRERRTRILTRLEDPEGAGTLLERIGATPRCAEEVDFARRFGHRQNKAIHRTTEIPLAEAPEINIEAHAANLIGASGAAVFHLENGFPLGLAGLAFWEVIFDDIPGAFTNPFQSGPLDLFWPDFATTRSKQLACRRAELADPKRLHQELRRTFECKHGIANRLVSWRHFTSDVLEAALANIPPEDLLNLASHVIRWPYRTRTGFPDLVVIYGPGNHEFVEVKGPTDQLQPAQRVWLKALSDLGQSARVLKFKAC
jgi:hypothetical protein